MHEKPWVTLLIFAGGVAVMALGQLLYDWGNGLFERWLGKKIPRQGSIHAMWYLCYQTNTDSCNRRRLAVAEKRADKLQERLDAADDRTAAANTEWDAAVQQATDERRVPELLAAADGAPATHQGADAVEQSSARAEEDSLLAQAYYALARSQSQLVRYDQACNIIMAHLST
jgi:hypothetical protein